jgi:hypothetical protein
VQIGERVSNQFGRDAAWRETQKTRVDRAATAAAHNVYISRAAIAVIIGWLYAAAGGDDLRAATAATKSRRAFVPLDARENNKHRKRGRLKCKLLLHEKCELNIMHLCMREK